MKNSEESLREFQDIIKPTIIGVPVGREKKRPESIFKKLTENFPDIEKQVDIQIHKL